MAWWGLFVCCPGQEDEAVCESDRVGPGPEGIGSFRWGGGVQLVACDGLDFSETGGSDNGIQGWQSMIFLAVLMTLCTAFLFSVAYLRTKHPGSTRAYCPLRRGRISGAACHAFMCGWQFADGDGN